jgi:tRNA pseudouridine55 synthase
MTESQSGFLLIDKPAGITSHDVVDAVRRVTGIRRVGHGGTLDPFATGLLIVGVGREATRELGTFIGKDKEYEATMRFGATSDSQDKDGTITETSGVSLPTEKEFHSALTKFTGNIQQIPPMYSAKKIKGKKLYELARQGQEVRRDPIEITVHELEPLSFDSPTAGFRVRCSSGTYVRTLAHDIGQMLGCGAYLTQLRRTKIATLSVTDALTLSKLKPDSWQEQLKMISELTA